MDHNPRVSFTVAEFPPIQPNNSSITVSWKDGGVGALGVRGSAVVKCSCDMGRLAKAFTTATRRPETPHVSALGLCRCAVSSAHTACQWAGRGHR